MSSKHEAVDYSSLRHHSPPNIPKTRYSLVVFLGIFQVAFIVLFASFGSYDANGTGKYEGKYSDQDQVPKYYASKLLLNLKCFIVFQNKITHLVFQDVHTMMFIGFGFLMTFLKKYGYGSVG